MIRSHAVFSSEPIHEGGSAVAMCGKPIHCTHWLAFSEHFGGLVSEAEVRLNWSDITCNKCRFAVWPEGFIYAAISFDEYEQLKAKGRLPDAG